MSTPKWNWETGEGLLSINDPAEVDAALDRRDPHIGAAVIGLALNCPPDVVSPRIIRALELLPSGQGRDFPFTAIAHLARLDGELTPELYAALRVEGLGGAADNAIDDTLGFVPFRDLPPWLKRRWVYVTVRETLLRWLRPVEAIGEAWRGLRGRRRG